MPEALGFRGEKHFDSLCHLPASSWGSEKVAWEDGETKAQSFP